MDGEPNTDLGSYCILSGLKCKTDGLLRARGNLAGHQHKSDGTPFSFFKSEYYCQIMSSEVIMVIVLLFGNAVTTPRDIHGFL